MALSRPAAEQIIWQTSRGRAIGSGVLAVLLVVMTVSILFAVAGSIGAELDPAARAAVLGVLLVLAFCCAALAQLVWRNARGFWNGWLAVDKDGISFSLPRDRSLVHRPKAEQGQLAWNEITRFEYRMEGYRTWLMAMVQQTYWVVPKTGEWLLLFEDRGLNTNILISGGDAAFKRLAKLAPVPVVEGAMVEGKGGLLGAWFTQAAPVHGVPMEESSAGNLWDRAGFTGRIAAIATAFVILAMIIDGLVN